MRVKVVSVRCFEVFTPDGTSLGLFKFEGDWQGLMLLRSLSDPAQSVVVDPSSPSIASIFGDVFGEHRAEVEVVKASPDLGREIVHRQGLT